jgi:adenylate cyclase class IV
MLGPHNEIELKFRLQLREDTRRIIEWCQDQKAYRVEKVKGYDRYYRQGENVVRHRCDGKAGTLTVKKRTDLNSTTNRVEVDLHFDDKITEKDVQAFLLASGWVFELELLKSATIFWYGHDDYSMTIVVYGIHHNGATDHYLELEIEKGSDVSIKYAKELLNYWSSKINKALPGVLSAPLNDSLYEIYSGKRYALAL